MRAEANAQIAQRSAWWATPASRVVTRNVRGVNTPHGIFVPTGNHQISPGSLCYFESCGEASFALTCHALGAKAAGAKAKATLKVIFAKKVSRKK
ncbi:MAG: hypothetical protein JWN66_3443 [Sphingomonas bacterium]|nr:hypothetical protein [Sphingomonas bacterium]